MPADERIITRFTSATVRSAKRGRFDCINVTVADGGYGESAVLLRDDGEDAEIRTTLAELEAVLSVARQLIAAAEAEAEEEGE